MKNNFLPRFSIMVLNILSSAGIVIIFIWLTGFAYPVFRYICFDSAGVLQGGTFVFTVHGVRHDVLLECFYNGNNIPLYKTDEDTWKGMVGIPVFEQPGFSEIQIMYRNLWKEMREETIPVTIAQNIFKKEKIRFSHKTRKLYANPCVPAERKHLASTYILETPNKWREGPFVWPVKSRITSPFGAQRVYVIGKSVAGYHRGIDMSAPTGTPIYAANRGHVVLARDMVLAGKTVVIDHGQGVISIYKHLSKLCVSEGDIVQQEDLLGLSGSGGLATGAHLHWELLVHGVPVNPSEWIEKEF